MPPYDPANDFYFRQSQLTFPPQNLPPVNCRFVSNREEANATILNGYAYNLFLDMSNGNIYLKKLNNNGIAEFLTYTINEEKNIDPMEKMDARLTRIEQMLGGMKNESISNDVGYVKPAAVSQSAVAEQNEPNGPAESAGFPKNEGNDFWKKRK